MKKLFFLFFISLFSLSICYAEGAIILDNYQPGPDFRHVSWGMMKDNVISIEKNKLIKNSWFKKVPENELIYKTSISKLNGQKVELHYLFKNNLLIGAYYLYIHTYPYKLSKDDPWAACVEDFMKLKSAINSSKKYGAPLKDESYWTDESSMNSKEPIGSQIKGGHHKKIVQWQNLRTCVTLSIQTYNNKGIITKVEYFYRYNDIPKVPDGIIIPNNLDEL
jgi:hypothetical protein